MTAPAQTPVLIVGAGPVGLLGALLLARRGVPSLVLERRAERSRAPKAHAVNPRSLEICQAAGVDAARVGAAAAPAAESAQVRFVTRLLGEELGALPYERQDEAVRDLAPWPLVNIAQPDFEAILLEAAAASSLVELRTGARWAGAREDGAGVVSTVEAGADTLELRSDFLIGCDGATSAVRASLGVAMEGQARVQHALNIHFSAELAKRLGARPAILYWVLDPAAPGTFIAYRLGAEMAFVRNYDPEREPVESFTPERCEDLVRAAAGDPELKVTVHGVSPWVMTTQVAARYRSGRIFLAGDAAHRFPPAGGLGLNTGVADADNLSWKLAAVLRGWGGPALLDSYEAERRPVALANAAQSLQNARGVGRLLRAVGPHDELAGRIRDPAGRAAIGEAIAAQTEHFNSLGLQLGYVYGGQAAPGQDVSIYVPTPRVGARAPHAWVRRDGRRVSILELLSPERFTLLAGPQASAWRAQAAGAAQLVDVASAGREFEDEGGVWTTVAELSGEGALLVRPDGHVAMHAPGPPGTPDALRQALSALLGRPTMAPGVHVTERPRARLRPGR